jgi:cation/acetate symporter
METWSHQSWRGLGGDWFLRVHQRVAFATILAVVAGLTMSASTSFAHDFYTNVIHHGKEKTPGEEVRVARITAFVVGAVSIFLAIQMRSMNVAFLVGLAFAVAASANLPVILFSVLWKRFNTARRSCRPRDGARILHSPHPDQPEWHLRQGRCDLSSRKPGHR